MLDPFFGTGTTGAVAKLTGRNYIGIEREASYIAAARKRIENIKTVHNAIHDLQLEVKPPNVAVKTLLQHGYLSEGQLLYDKTGHAIARVESNGFVSDGNTMLSIHKMSARLLGRLNNNGWNYFWIKDAGKFIPIDTLRYRFYSQNN